MKKKFLFLSYLLTIISAEVFAQRERNLEPILRFSFETMDEVESLIKNVVQTERQYHIHTHGTSSLQIISQEKSGDCTMRLLKSINVLDYNAIALDILDASPVDEEVEFSLSVTDGELFMTGTSTIRASQIKTVVLPIASSLIFLPSEIIGMEKLTVTSGNSSIHAVNSITLGIAEQGESVTIDNIRIIKIDDTTGSAKTPIFYSFESKSEIDGIAKFGFPAPTCTLFTDISSSPVAVTEGRSAVKINYENVYSEYSSALILLPQPVNIEPHNAIAFDVKNIGNSSVTLHTSFDDRYFSHTGSTELTSATTVHQDSAYTIVVPFSNHEIQGKIIDTRIYGKKAKIADHIYGKTSQKSITGLHFFTHAEAGNQNGTLVIDNIRSVEINQINKIPLIKDKMLISFEKEHERRSPFLEGTNVSFSSEGATDGGYAIKAVFHNPDGDWDQINLNFSLSQNLDHFNVIYIDVTNRSKYPKLLYIGLDDTSADVHPQNNRLLGSVAIQSDTTQTIAVALKPPTLNKPMHGYPFVKGLATASLIGGADVRKVVTLFFSMKGAIQEELYFDNIRGLYDPDYSINSIIDQWGQYNTATDWPGKINANTEDLAKIILQSRKNREDSLLNLSPKSPEQDIYGGYMIDNGVYSCGTQKCYFRTQLIGNKWWFITPNGNRFWSTGVGLVRSDSDEYPLAYKPHVTVGAPTIVPYPTESYRYLYASLPELRYETVNRYGNYVFLSGDEGLGEGSIVEYVRLHLNNIQLKYGNPEYLCDAPALAYRRLKSWGFNTIGGRSDFSPQYAKFLPIIDPYIVPPVYEDFDCSQRGQDLTYRIPAENEKRIPYTILIQTLNGFPDGSTWKPTPKINTGTTNEFGYLPDVFNPDFIMAVDHAVTDQTNANGDGKNLVGNNILHDKFLLGYFVDNEMKWSGVEQDDTYRHLRLAQWVFQTTTSSSRTHFQNLLKMQYNDDLDALSTNWGTSYVSWSDVGNGLDSVIGRIPVQRDLQLLIKEFATRYYKVVDSVLSAHDSNHLYLGSRFATFTEEVIEAANSSCDVLSFNLYYSDLTRWPFFNNFKIMVNQGKVTKPVIIGEFHFGSKDRGMFSGGLVEVVNQEERGKSYRRYVESVLAEPQFIGCHWFMYMDESLVGGMFSAENYNIGLVNCNDTPYWKPMLNTSTYELIDYAQEINYQIYCKRLNNCIQQR